MGTGINAQKSLAALHHVDAPWLPAFVEQRNCDILHSSVVPDKRNADPAGSADA